MDAKLLLRSFERTQVDDDESNLHVMYSGILDDMLHGLYEDGDVHFLGDLPSPRVTDEARDNLQMNQAFRVASATTTKNFNQIRRPGKTITKLDFVNFALPQQPTNDTEAVQISERERYETTGLAFNFSVQFLSKAISKFASHAPVTDKKLEQTAVKAAKGALGESRRIFSQTFSGHLGTLILTENFVGTQPVGYEVASERPAGRGVSRFILEADKKGGATGSTGAFLTELDAYVALMEWAATRELPAVPIFTPTSLETGNQLTGGKNRRSDLLLCSLIAPEIVPIQAKSSHHRKTQNEYDTENIVLVSPQDLGQVELNQAIVEQEGRNKSGRQVHTYFGRLLTAWVNVYRDQNPNNGKKKQLHKLMGPAFKFFDQKIKL